MEDSPIGLGKWLVAMWQIVNCKNGASSYEIHRAIGVTQKTAWFLDRRIRFALGLGPGNKFSGQIEADETFIDGKARNMHKDRRARGVTEGRRQEQGRGHGIPERGEKVRTKAIGDTKKKTLHAEIRAHVLAGSAILPMPQSPTKGLDYFQHEAIDHAVEYVRGEVHTNGLEKFPGVWWSRGR
jgi:hypothetical protein